MNSEDSEFFEDSSPEDWARASAGSASYCPYCGYSVVDTVNSDRYSCPDCGVEYSVNDHERD